MAKLQVADSALGSVVSQLTKAISLATGANNGTKSAIDIQAIAQEISGIRDEVMTLANTSYQGQFLFAGTKTASSPFTTDTTTSPLQRLISATQTSFLWKCRMARRYR